MCPACYSAFFLDALYCNECQSVITGRYIELEGSGDIYCDECYVARNYND